MKRIIVAITLSAALQLNGSVLQIGQKAVALTRYASSKNLGISTAFGSLAFLGGVRMGYQMHPDNMQDNQALSEISNSLASLGACGFVGAWIGSWSPAVIGTMTYLGGLHAGYKLYPYVQRNCSQKSSFDHEQ